MERAVRAATTLPICQWRIPANQRLNTTAEISRCRAITSCRRSSTPRSRRSRRKRGESAVSAISRGAGLTDETEETEGVSETSRTDAAARRIPPARAFNADRWRRAARPLPQRQAQRRHAEDDAGGAGEGRRRAVACTFRVENALWLELTGHVRERQISAFPTASRLRERFVVKYASF